MKKLARAMQIRFNSILGNAKQHRCFVNSRAEPIIQSQGRLIDLGEGSNALCKGVIALRRLNLPVRSRLQSHCLGENRLVRVWASEADARFHVHRLVERDPVDPGAEFGVAAKRPDGAVGLEKNVLRHVFRFRNELPPQNRNREAKHLGTVSAKEFSESQLIAVPRAFHELGIALRSCQRGGSPFRKWKAIRPTPKKATGRGDTQKRCDAAGRIK